MTEEMMNDTLDDLLTESGDEEEQDAIVNQVGCICICIWICICICICIRKENLGASSNGVEGGFGEKQGVFQITGVCPALQRSALHFSALHKYWLTMCFSNGSNTHLHCTAQILFQQR